MKKKNRKIKPSIKILDDQTKQTNNHQKFLKLFYFFLIIFLSFTAYAAYDNYSFKKSLPNFKSLETKLVNQENIINVQKQQIQNFTNEINELKLKSKELNNQNIFSGMGGPSPKYKDINLLLKRNRNIFKEQNREQIKKKLSAKEQKRGKKNKKSSISSIPSILPVKGYLTSRFGYRISPFSGRREFHKGLDISNAKKTPIIATADGIVIFSGPNGPYGNVVLIDHGHGLITRYAHLFKTLKRVGLHVKKGEKIAFMGNTGQSTGSHLHYEIILNGRQINPQKYVKNMRDLKIRNL